MLLGALNGTDFIYHPWNTTFAAYTDLIGPLFYIIVLCFIAVALYIKTHNATAVGSFLWIGGILLVSGSIFINAPEMAMVFTIFTALALAGTFLSIYFGRKYNW